MIIYSKLVRDRIPEIIEANGTKYTTHIADNKEFELRLYNKLAEEIQEFKDKPSIEEFVDIMEVLESISKFNKFSIAEIKILKKEKKKNRGGFDKRIVLDSTE